MFDVTRIGRSDRVKYLREAFQVLGLPKIPRSLRTGADGIQLFFVAVCAEALRIRKLERRVMKDEPGLKAGIESEPHPWLRSYCRYAFWTHCEDEPRAVMEFVRCFVSNLPGAAKQNA